MSRIIKDKKGVQMELSVFVYCDSNHPNGDIWVAYCPELDLAGYDHGEDAAKQSFNFVLEEYLKYVLSNGTLEEDLLSHGWRKYKNGKLIEPSYKSMVRQGRLDMVASMQNYSKYSIPLVV